MTLRERLELAAYQLNDVSQVSFGQLRDETPLRDGLVYCEVFIEDFLGGFFPV